MRTRHELTKKSLRKNFGTEIVRRQIVSNEIVNGKREERGNYKRKNMSKKVRAKEQMETFLNATGK